MTRIRENGRLHKADIAGAEYGDLQGFAPGSGGALGLAGRRVNRATLTLGEHGSNNRMTAAG
jgi:hypothetical protein